MVKWPSLTVVRTKKAYSMLQRVVKHLPHKSEARRAVVSKGPIDKRMTYFPVLERLYVSNCVSYPDVASQGQLESEFKVGLKVVLGVNGLGKCELIAPPAYAICPTVPIFSSSERK